MNMTVERRRVSTLPKVLLDRLSCTYQVTSSIDRVGGMRYVLRRSDGTSCNVCRHGLLRIIRLGKLRNEHGEEVRHV